MKQFWRLFFLFTLLLTVSGVKAKSEREISDLAWSPDGTLLAINASDGLRVYRVEGDVPQLLWQSAKDQFVTIQFSPLGTWLTAGTAHYDQMDAGKIYIWMAQSGLPVASFVANRRGIYVLSFSPDEQRLVTGGGDRYGDFRLRTWDTTTWQDIPDYQRSGWGPISEAVFSPDQRYLAFSSRYGPVTIIDIETNTISALIHKTNVWTIRFNPEMTHVFLERGSEMEIWEIRREPEFHLVRQNQDNARSSDNTENLLPGEYMIQAAIDRFVTISKNNIVRVRSSDTGEIEFAYFEENRRFIGIAFNRQGTQLAFITDAVMSYNYEDDTGVALWEPGEAKPVYLTLD